VDAEKLTGGSSSVPGAMGSISQFHTTNTS
jgi:hypothetical protein